MNVFDVQLLVDEVPEGIVDEIIDTFEGTTGHDHTGSAFVNGFVEAPTFLDAVESFSRWLEERGCVPQRVDLDLATRGDIARRLGATRQAAANWAAGRRGAGFPTPFNPVSGGVWLWGDVVAWAIEHGRLPPETPLPPQAEAVTLANSFLLRQSVG